jgi:hypothetical protein
MVENLDCNLPLQCSLRQILAEIRITYSAMSSASTLHVPTFACQAKPSFGTGMQALVSLFDYLFSHSSPCEAEIHEKAKLHSQNRNRRHRQGNA